MTAVLVVVGLLGVAVIALLVTMRRALRPRSARHVGDQLMSSPDGRYWWDGERWQPVGPPPRP